VKKSEKIAKTLLMITIISLLTYAVMAVITHFSLNYQLPEYKFYQSLQSIFDTKTDIFIFFIGFIIINIVWISSALIIRLFIKYFKRKYENF